MGKGNRKRKHKKQSQRTGEERDLLKEREMERFERDAERRAKLFPTRLAPRADSAPPPIFGEAGPLVRAPLKPRPHLRSGSIALPEPEQEEFLVVMPLSLIQEFFEQQKREREFSRSLCSTSSGTVRSLWCYLGISYSPAMS